MARVMQDTAVALLDMVEAVIAMGETVTATAVAAVSAMEEESMAVVGIVTGLVEEDMEAIARLSMGGAAILARGMVGVVVTEVYIYGFLPLFGCVTMGCRTQLEMCTG